MVRALPKGTWAKAQLERKRVRPGGGIRLADPSTVTSWLTSAFWSGPASVRGLNIASTTATGLSGGAVAGVSVSEASVTSTTGTAVNLSGTVGLTSVTANGAANNTVQESTSFNGINANVGIVTVAGSAATNVTITGNTVREIDYARAILVQQIDHLPADGNADTVCAGIGSNTFSNVVGNPGDGTLIRVRRSDHSTTSVFQRAPGDSDRCRHCQRARRRQRF